MIKKIIACLTICFIITGIISPVFSNASALPQPNWSDPGISEIINISDLTGWMLNGGTFDVSTYTNAESFMNDYYNSRTRTRLVSPSEDPNEDYYEVLPGFGINNQFVPGDSFARPLDTNRVIASSFRDHTGYGRRLSNEVNEALLSSGSLYDTKIPLLNEIEFANFVNYNHDALRLYSEFFNNESSDITPNPDPDFSFINNINNLYLGNSNILLYDKTIIKDAYGDITLNDTLNNFTIISDNYSNLNSHLPGGQTGGLGLRIYAIQPITTIRLYTQQDNSVSAYYDNSVTVPFGTFNDMGRLINIYQLVLQGYNNEGYLTNYWSYSDTQFNNTYLQNQFAGLSTAVNYVYQHYSNINLYVDDNLWALAGAPSPSPTITPEFPDAVGGEELETTTWPIFRPRAPYYTNVPGVLQAIEDAIADDGELDIDDLKPYLTDENGDPVPDPIFDPEPVPIPVPDPINPEVVPGLPVLPVMPPEMPGFSGVSVLAEIINFTNQSLPTSLIVTFWGIVFGIVILGLIKILHK